MQEIQEERKSFLLYKSFRNLLLRLPMEERGRLITAIYEYIYEGKVSVEMSEVTEMALCSITDTIDRDGESYAEKCRVNRENGKKGGRPRKNYGYSDGGDFLSPKTERFFEKPKKPDNDNDNDNSNDTVTDNGDVNDTEKDNDTVNGAVNGNDARFEKEADGFRSAANAVSDLPRTPEREFFVSEKNGGSEGLSAVERDALTRRGVSDRYIDERLERGTYYAARQKKRLSDLLLEWWQSDKDRYSPPPEEHRGSFDTDEFFEAALKRSFSGL